MHGSGTVPFGRKKAAPTIDERAVARLLAEHGPVAGDDAAELLGWTPERWWNVVSTCTEWFDLTGKGWVLTEAGRMMVE